MSLLDYGMCTQTVTVYRKAGNKVQRIVLEGCNLQTSLARKLDETGAQMLQPFLLVVPGTEQLVFPGDRVLEGIGPVVASWDQTQSFLEAEYAAPFCWMGQFCHTEAGRKG